MRTFATHALASLAACLAVSLTSTVSSAFATTIKNQPNAGAYSCVPATAANSVPTPPPIWDLPGGKPPSAAQLARAASLPALCPLSEVPGHIGARGVAVHPGGPNHATQRGLLRGDAVPPTFGSEHCEKGGCFWYVEDEVQYLLEGEEPKRSAIGMEYETTVADPEVSSFSGAHSIDQLAVGNGPGGNQYTLELGWSVAPTQGWESGEPKAPHLFMFFNPDKYKEGGESCYDCHFEPATGAKYSPGQVLPVSSERLKFGVKYLSECFPKATGGCWWLWVGTGWIGYVPESAYKGNFTYGDNVNAYGEVFDNEADPTSQMGDGQYGASASATPMTQILAILHGPLGESIETTGYHVSQTDGELYSPGDVNKAKTEWHFGGPGHDPVPLVTTEGATLAPPGGAEVRGTVVPSNLESHYYFEYGLTESYGSSTATTLAGSGVEPVAGHASLSGLHPGATYHYRIVAYNKDGYAYGADETFSVPFWRIEATQNPHGFDEADRFTGVSCWSATECDAAGFYAPETEISGLVERWNGSSWTQQATAKSSEALGDVFEGISCRSASECEAVGHAELSGGKFVTLAEVWNGTSWSVQTTPANKGEDSVLDNISCVSAKECIATGYYLPTIGKTMPLAEIWNGTAWKVQTLATLPKQDENAWLASVSCPAAKSCIAVGRADNSINGQISLAESWNGTKWTLQTTPKPEHSIGEELRAVSCSAAGACTAVGEYNNYVEGGRRALIERYNGTSWSLQEAASPFSGSPPKGSKWEMNGVSCPTSTSCIAVGTFAESSTSGNQALAEEWNGTRWALAPAMQRAGVVANEPRSVSCTAELACTFVGISWKKENHTETLAERTE
ncbi:MAG TPA: neprosin family prolyl endopeptidase [Solirubrobacteraceae bacterium]|nr:neprosin family prolyl endopeptidase [Solirubrobacteraceae bacterium]